MCFFLLAPNFFIYPLETKKIAEGIGASVFCFGVAQNIFCSRVAGLCVKKWVDSKWA